ncbi:hypothetical protein YC2023_009948 [Brassica napus]
MTEHDRDRDRSGQITEKRRAPSHDSASKIQLPALQDPTPHSTDLRRALSRREDGEASGDHVSSGHRPIKERLMLPDIPHSTDLRRSLSLRDDGNEMGGQTSANRPPVKQRKSWNHHDSIPVDPQAPVLQEPSTHPRKKTLR